MADRVCNNATNGGASRRRFSAILEKLRGGDQTMDNACKNQPSEKSFNL